MIRDMWDEKYRPKTINEYITQNDDLKEMLDKWLAIKIIPHLLLSGHHGTGKTSLAYMLKSELEIDDFDFLKLNGSSDNSIDVMRGRVLNFISGMAVSGDFKIVFIDEADRLSIPALDFLKNAIEDNASNARFILTTNKSYKIPNELKSRFTEIKFDGPNKIAMTERFIQILAAEKVKIKSLELVQEYVDAHYPDFRQLLLAAERNVRDGRLIPWNEMASDSTEFMVKIIEHLETDNWIAAREYLSKNVPDDKWEECYRFLYDYLGNIGKFEKDVKKWKVGIIVIGDHLYKHGFVADAEINFAACLARLSEI